MYEITWIWAVPSCANTTPPLLAMATPWVPPASGWEYPGTDPVGLHDSTVEPGLWDHRARAWLCVSDQPILASDPATGYPVSGAPRVPGDTHN